MKRIFKNQIITSALLFLVLVPTNAFAQEEFEDDVNDEAPINTPAWILVASAAGAGIGYRFLRKREAV